MNEQFFTTLNGYKVKDEYAIHTYDTVVNMKADTKLKEGMHVKTKGYYTINDNANCEYIITDTESNSDYQEELNNGLYATLLFNDYVTPEMFGAKGDGIVDDGTILNTVIQFAYSKKVKLILDKIYLTSETLLLDKEGLNIDILNTLTYTGNDSAIEITSNRNILNINKIYSSGKGITISCSDSLVEANHVNVEYINSTDNCIELISTSGGNAYNEIRFTTLISTVGHYCIYLSATGSSFVGENTIYGGKCQRGTWGVYATSDHTGGIPVVKLYNVCFEGVRNGIYFNNVLASTINYPRYAELEQLENAILLSINGDCRDCIFNGNHPIDLAKIESNITAPETTSSRPIILNTPIMNSDGTTIGKKAWLTKKGKSIFPTDIRKLNVTSSKANLLVSFNEQQYQYFDVNYTTTITLNTSYIPQVINTIYINYSSDKRLILKDSDDNTIHDGTNYSTGLYKITLIRSGNNTEYITEEVNTVS